MSRGLLVSLTRVLVWTSSFVCGSECVVPVRVSSACRGQCGLNGQGNVTRLLVGLSFFGVCCVGGVRLCGATVWEGE